MGHKAQGLGCFPTMENQMESEMEAWFLHGCIGGVTL